MKRVALLAFLTAFSPEARAGVITQYQADGLAQFQGHFAALSFDQYHGPGVLESVTLTEHATIRNDFSLTFYNAATISISDRESIFGFAPITMMREATSAGAEKISLPEVATPFSRTVALDPKSFVGTGKYTIPVDSAAFSTFASSDGNGFGSVKTYGTADATLTFTYQDVPPPVVPTNPVVTGPTHGGGGTTEGPHNPVSAVPEPGTMTLLWTGIVVGLAVQALRFRASRTAVSGDARSAA